MPLDRRPPFTDCSNVLRCRFNFHSSWPLEQAKMAAVISEGVQKGEPIAELSLIAVVNSTVGDAKKRQMDGFTLENNSSTPLTTYFGTKIAVGRPVFAADGRKPTLRSGRVLADRLFSRVGQCCCEAYSADFHNREKISHFDHERIPERAVHARGAGAFGEFKLHTPLTGLTTAKILTETKVTPAYVRFSTVGGSRGSADTVRDPRGMAVRFYTDEGNWDIGGCHERGMSSWKLETTCRCFSSRTPSSLSI